MRKRSAELGVPCLQMQDHMKNALNYKPYYQTFTNELSHVDMNRCHDACRALLNAFLNATSHLQVLCTDHSTHDRNVVFWAMENPHLPVDFEYDPPHVMMWAGMTAAHLNRLHFFDGPVNAASYANMLEAWLIQHLRDRGFMEDLWL